MWRIVILHFFSYNEGTFTYTSKGHHVSKLKSGGHGQAGMDILKKEGIKFNIVKTYSNGVRVGNIPGHKDPKKTYRNRTSLVSGIMG